MKKYLMGIFALVLAVGMSAFTTSNSKTDVSKQTTYDWYEVDYSTDASGIIPEGATRVFDDYTQATAESSDACQTTGSRHCLRGFQGTPPTFPTSSYDASTQKF